MYVMNYEICCKGNENNDLVIEDGPIKFICENFTVLETQE